MIIIIVLGREKMMVSNAFAFVCYIIAFSTIVISSLSSSTEEVCVADIDNNEQNFPCSVYLARSTIPNGGFGLFAGVPIPRGRPVGPPDIAVHLIDLPTDEDNFALRNLHEKYAASSHVTGGQFEGNQVHALLPGIGMVANGLAKDFNVIPYRPDVNEADVARTTSPGTGAISHYFNMSYFSFQDIRVGEEFFVKFTEDSTSLPKDKSKNRSKDIKWLKNHGICLDKIRQGKSSIKNLGRGAFATRYIGKGEIITSSPLLMFDDKSVFNMEHKTKLKKVTSEQLLVNYCFGHVHSSVLLYPYGPVVNFINHDSQSPNAEIRWSTVFNEDESSRMLHEIQFEDVSELSPTSLTIDYVALRPIKAGEEIFIDYGSAWENSWKQHVQTWSPPPNAELYSPSYVMDEVVYKIRTLEEQQIHPYPENIVTACFYRYSDAVNSSQPVQKKNSDGKKVVTTIKWKATRGIFNFDYLRPCTIISRVDNIILKQDSEPQSLYTVLIKNRKSLPENEKVPKGAKHIVTHIPRYALRFVDKPYTTDQTLEGSFRNPIGMPEGMFPKMWLNLMHN